MKALALMLLFYILKIYLIKLLKGFLATFEYRHQRIPGQGKILENGTLT